MRLPSATRRRVIAVLAAWLLIGTLLNIAVTWGLCLFNGDRFGARSLGSFAREVSHIRIMDGTYTLTRGGVSAEWTCAINARSTKETADRISLAGPAQGSAAEYARAESELASWGMFGDVMKGTTDPRIATGVQSAYGWPMRSLGHTYLLRADYVERDILGFRWEWLARRFKWDAQRAFPLLPLFPGFIVNTLLFAAAAWCMCFCAVGTWRLVNWRARTRRRRGWCLACGYDLNGLAISARCPECGSPRCQTSEPANSKG